MKRLVRVVAVAQALLLAGASVVQAQQAPFEDVIRNLRNPDPKVRGAAVRLLREARHVEAITPLAPLVNDAVDEIQLEAIGAELSFYLVEDVPAKRRRGFLLEVRQKGAALPIFEQGPLAAWRRPVPPELVDALIRAIDDENQRVRQEAIYTLGVIVQPPLPTEPAEQLIKALDHYDPSIRAAAARVIGRVGVATAGDALLKAVNDSNAQVRYASMRALGQIREERAVQALTDQLKYYVKGEGAWSALDALAHIAHPSSVPLFKSHLTDRDEYLRRAAIEGLARVGDNADLETLRTTAVTDHSPMVRAAATFALQKLGQPFMARLVDFFGNDRLVLQVQEYLFELGPAAVPELLPRLQEPQPELRARVAEVIGALGDESAVPALEALTKDRDRTVAAAASEAIERINTTR